MQVPSSELLGLQKAKKAIYDIFVENPYKAFTFSELKSQLSRKNGIKILETSISARIREINQKLRDFNEPYKVQWRWLTKNGKNVNTVYQLIPSIES